jgi:DNA-binding transcriptional LysR family regulator
VTLRDIRPEPYITLTIDEAEDTTLRYWRQYGSAPNVTFRTSSMEAIRNLVATGAGVTILSDMVYRPWSLEGDRLEAMSMFEPIPSMDVGIAWKRGAKLTRYAKAFRDSCHATFNASADKLLAA